MPHAMPDQANNRLLAALSRKDRQRLLANCTPVELVSAEILAEPGERIIAIGGSGHMAILKQLLAIDGRLEGVAVDPYF